MKRYDKYKESGISWIGEIPEHWEKRRCKDILTECKEPVGDECDNYTLLSLTTNGVIIRDVSEGKGKFPKDFDTYKVVNPSNLIFCLFDVDETPRTVGCSCHRGMITGAYNVFSVESVSVDYLHYYFISLDDRKALKPLYKGLRKVVPLPAFMSMQIYLPPLSEQETIVAYLEEKVAQMDNLVAKQEAMIAYLRELKQVIIAKAVTQGLDPQAPFRPSGIPWLGDIPEHWEVKKLSQVSKEYFVSNKNIKHQNLLSLSYGRIVQKDINTTEGLLPSSYDSYQVIRQGNIVLRLTDLQNDQTSLRVGLCTQEGIITPAYLSLLPRNTIISDYLYYELHTADIKKVFYGMGSGLRQNLNWGELRKLSLPLPPLSEQEAIVTYINRKTEEIDRLIAMTEQEIARVRELKQRVIADVVTGRINVQPS